MIVFIAIVAAILGFIFFQFHIGGAAVAVALAYAFAQIERLQRRVVALEQQLSGAPATPTPTAAPKAIDAPSPTSAEVFVPFERDDTPQARSTSTAAPSAKQPMALLPSWLRRFFTDGNWAVRIGVVILFFGVAFLLKYAAEHARLPIELRLSGVGIGAAVLLALGWRLRRRRAAYAVMLQGGGVGILYLNLFAALRLYHVIPASAAFVLLVAVAVFSAVLAVLQNARALAVLGMAGGFLAPVLTATDSGNHVLLFSYYALLNAGIVAIAWYRAWRELNLLGFVFTFVIGAIWGYLTYRAEFFVSTEPFLILFFLFYVTIAILFAVRQPDHRSGYIDGTLLFGAPIVGFALQAAMMKPFEHGLGISALALAGFYLVLGTLLLRRLPGLRLMTEGFLALGVIFLTLVFPLLLDAHWTTATWAIEGTGLIWIGVRQSRRPARVFGVLLQIAAGIAFTLKLGGDRNAALPLVNRYFVGAMLLTMSAGIGAFLLERRARILKGIEHRFLAYLLFAWALLWLWYGVTSEVARDIEPLHRSALSIAAFAVLALLSSTAARRISWRWLHIAALLVLPLLYQSAVATWLQFGHVFAQREMVAWLFGMASYLWVLRQADKDDIGASWLHALWLWLGALSLASELAWRVSELNIARAWAVSAWMVSLIAVWQLVLLLSRRTLWPFAALRTTYLGLGVAPLAALSILAGLHSHTLAEVTPLEYWPLLNPIDIANLLLIGITVEWRQAVREELDLHARRQLLWLIGVMAFLWLNAMLLRSVHRWADVAYTVAALSNSMSVQAALSIFWSICALVAMLLGGRYRLRAVWGVGAALLAVVIVKLFFIDLSSTGSIARIVSFIGVGVLLLLIGYVAPVPPRQGDDDELPAVTR